MTDVHGHQTIEKVQRRASRKIKECGGKSYNKRLKFVGITMET